MRKGCEQAFEAVLERLAREALRYPGHEGVTVLRPQPGGSTYTIVIHFRSKPELAAWTSSEVRARLIAEADSLCEGGIEVQELSGLEGWFRLPGAPVIIPPPRYKIAAVTWLAIMPLTILLGALATPFLRFLPPLARPAPLTLVSIVLMTYLVMPEMTRLFRFWLYPGRSASGTS